MARIGVDLVEIARIEGLRERWGQRFLERIFTNRELSYALSKRRAPEHLAARFAAKEALIKAHGLPSPWKEIEVSKTTSGEPRFSKLPGGLKPERVQLSLAHTASLAIAIVLIESP